jgi:hypothetical protein
MSIFPKEYQKFWVPYTAEHILHHITTAIHLRNIIQDGIIQPRDPAPKQWAGLSAIFLSDPNDPRFGELYEEIVMHVREKHKHMVRLHIQTTNPLWRTGENGMFQIVSLAPIPVNDIQKIEEL